MTGVRRPDGEVIRAPETHHRYRPADLRLRYAIGDSRVAYPISRLFGAAS